MEFKKFKTTVNTFMATEAKRRDKVQELLMVGLNKYDEDQDTSYLNYLIQSAIGVRSMPTHTLTGYIKDHANVSFGKLKDGKPGFKKSEKSEPAKVIQPTVNWYDWAGANHNNVEAEYDWEASIARLKQTIAAKLEKGTIKDPEKAAEALAYLERVA